MMEGYHQQKVNNKDGGFHSWFYLFVVLEIRRYIYKKNYLLTNFHSQIFGYAGNKPRSQFFCCACQAKTDLFTDSTGNDVGW